MKTCDVILRRQNRDGTTWEKPCGEQAKWFVAYVGTEPIDGPIAHARCTAHLNTLKAGPVADEFKWGRLVDHNTGVPVT